LAGNRRIMRCWPWIARRGLGGNAGTASAKTRHWCACGAVRSSFGTEPVQARRDRRKIQALDRTQPGLPMKKGRAGTMTHDYIRNGTTTLFRRSMSSTARSSANAWRATATKNSSAFSIASKPPVPAGKVIHAILDNYAVHKHPKVRAWLARHPRWTFHFTPTSCSWANAVEGFFATLTRRRLQHGVFHSLVDLQAAINRYLGEHNREPKPFVWTAPIPVALSKRLTAGTKRSRHTTSESEGGFVAAAAARSAEVQGMAHTRKPAALVAVDNSARFRVEAPSICPALQPLLG
jgi:transposase